MSAPDAETTVAIEGPFDLVATLRRTAVWGPDPTQRVRDDGAWIALSMESGPATVRYARRDDRALVSAWGPGAEEAVSRAPDHLGLHDRSWRFESDHPIVGPLLTRMRGLRFGRSCGVFPRLLAMIIGQRVTAEGAAQSFRELVWRYGERAPGPVKLWIPPSGERLRAVPYYDLHAVGIERRRAETILFAARRAKRLESLAALDPAEAYARLIAFPGVGPWTAALVTSAVHGDSDAVPVGDYHFPNHVVHALTGAPRGTDDEMLALLEPFRPHRGRALAAILRGAPSAPRFGPRMPVRDIRGM